MEKEDNLRFEAMIPKMNSIFDDIEHKILSPLSHLKEFDNHWKLEFDLPMVNKKDIKITFDRNIITVEANLKENYSEEKLGKITKFESFKKSMTLPGKTDAKKTTAKFQNGILEIKIPKIVTG